MFKNMCAFVVFFLVASASLAQRQAPLPVLQNKDYAAYLQQCSTVFPVIVQSPAKGIGYIAALAIALEKTGGWKSPTGEMVRKGVEAAPDALRYLEGMQALLHGDMKGITMFYDGVAPDSRALMQVCAVLREHEFTLAADALSVFTPDLPGKRILYLASIPKDKRAAVETTFLAQVTDPPNRMMLARTAIDMFLRPPAGITVDPKEFYTLALKIGKGTSIVSFDTAQQLLQGGKSPEAVQMVTQLAIDQPADELLQLRAARFLRTMGDQAAATTVYQQALITVPEPQRRDVRLDYLEYLQWQKKEDEITKLQTGKDALLAGDAALVAARYEDAAKQYATTLTSATAPLEKRLAAWIGMLDADPEQALKLGKDLLQELTKSDPKMRSSLVAWTARQLWSAMSREIPPKPGTFVIGWRTHFRPVHDVKDWEIQAAALATQLLDIDPEACLRPDPRFTPDSFRYPAAMLYALSGDPKNATAILGRTLEYHIPPPTGGWRIFDGTPTPDTDKPRTGTTPTLAESKKLTMLLVEDLSRCPNANERVPALSAVIAENLVDQLATSTKDDEIRAHLQALAAILKFTVVALDPLPRPLRTDLPPPPTRQVDMTRFAPLDALVRKALANDAVAKSGMLLVNEGLRDALLTASNPELLTTLTDLASYTIQRYADACHQPRFAVDGRKLLANYLSARPVYDMKPYIARLLQEGVKE